MMAPLALAVVIAGIAIAIGAALLDRSLVAGIPLMLDMWLAAGLLKLSQDLGWRELTAVAAIVIVRKLVMLAISQTTQLRSRSGAT